MFKQGDPIFHSKMLSFYRKENFDLEAVYANPILFMHVPQIGKDRNILTDLFLPKYQCVYP